MRTAAAIAISISLIACSGVAGMRDHADDVVIATHCRQRACHTPPQARLLGEGCYALHDPDTQKDHLYDCSTDRRSAGALSCLDVTPCGGECEMTITEDGQQLPIERCLDRWNADRAAQRSSHRPR